MIESGMHFAQANYGDGEMGCILGREMTNSQGEVYCPELRAALIRTLKEPCGMWCGLNPGNTLRDEAYRWIRDNGIKAPWVPKEIFPAANVNGYFGPFLAALRDRRTIVVGPGHLASLPSNVIGGFIHIPVPDAVAWMAAGGTCSEIEEIVEPGDVVLFAAGMGTNLMIHELWPDLQGWTTLLDVGATLDPYVGVFSRKNYLKPEWQEAKKKNLNPGELI